MVVLGWRSEGVGRAFGASLSLIGGLWGPKGLTGGAAGSDGARGSEGSWRVAGVGAVYGGGMSGMAGEGGRQGRAPLRVGRRDPSRLVFDWADGTVSAASAAAVRRGCPCAHCVDEHTGRKLLDPTSVSEGLEHREVSLVGNYALAIRFSDGHRTGIYTWDRLRGLSEVVAGADGG